MVKTPQISVLMAVYNRAEFVGLAVESVLRQTYSRFEFVIVDDGSTDDSRRILQGYADQDPRIRLIRQENAGLAAALNHGLRVAHGEFIARMDDDDIAEGTRLERQLMAMENMPECVVLGGQVSYIDEDGALLGGSKQKLVHEEIEHELLGGRGGAIIHPTAFMRKDALVSVGGYQERYRRVQDLDLFLRLGEVGRLANMNKELLKFRFHPSGRGSITSAVAQSRNDTRRTIIMDALERRGHDPQELDLRVKERMCTPGMHHARLAMQARKNGRRRTGLKHCARAMMKEPLALGTARAAVYQLPMAAIVSRIVARLTKRDLVREGVSHVVRAMKNPARA